MPRLPFAILAAVVLFLAVVGGVLLHRARVPRPQPPEPAASRADYRIKEVHLQEVARDGSRWQLHAEYGEIFEDQGKTVMKRVTIRVDQPRRAWTVTGDEGELLRASKDVEVRGNVVLTTSEGLRLETSVLRWVAAERRAWTDAPVTIYRGSVVVTGRGFESRLAQEASTVGGRVRATFSPRGGQARVGAGGGS